MSVDKRPIAIGARLEKSRLINTIGFKPNFDDYSPDKRRLIGNASRIYYPTAFYADLFNAMGKSTFPSFHTYKFAQDKIRQSAVFRMTGIPHPRTRVFYGPRQKKQILDYFSFPFVAKKARGSSRGSHVFLIHDKTDLDNYLEAISPAYIQEYIPVKKDIRVIVIGRSVALAYWRVAVSRDFRTNISRGGRIVFDPVPEQALNLALETAAACGWDDVGIDIVAHENRFHVLEGNMKYGTMGFKEAGISYKHLLTDLIVNNQV